MQNILETLFFIFGSFIKTLNSLKVVKLINIFSYALANNMEAVSGCFYEDRMLAN